MIPEITVRTWHQWASELEDYQLIDVREPEEYNDAHIGGLLIPIGELKHQWNRLSDTTPIVVMCRSGRRSAEVVAYLHAITGRSDIFNLAGGILAWQAAFPDMQ